MRYDYLKEWEDTVDKAIEEVINDEYKFVKYDDGKILMSLVDPYFVEDVAKVLTFGAKKYTPNGWQGVENGLTRYLDAMLRHLTAYQKGELIDPESGLTHLSHVAANVMFISYFNRQNESTTSPSK